MTFAALKVKNNSSELSINSSKLLDNLKLPSSFYNILDNFSYSNNNIIFKQSKFRIYPFEKENNKDLEIFFIKDLLNKILIKLTIYFYTSRK